MSNEAPSQHDIATGLLSEATGELALREQPVEVQDAASDYTAAVKDILATGNQLASDLADLAARRDLIPQTGWQRLHTESVEEATARASEADRRAERALAEMKAALTEAALPRLEGNREQLARQEAQIALGGAEGDKLVLRAMRIAQHGSPEAAAVLFTPFVRTMFAARGVQNPDAQIAQLKTVAAAKAVERGTTGREILAGKALANLGKLPASKTSALLHLRRAAG